MAIDKFDSQEGDEYWKNYFDRDPAFYEIIKEHMKLYIDGGELHGIDIGAGPGVGARLLSEAGIKTALTGYEPSKTHFSGVKFSIDLKKHNSTVTYKPVHGGLLNIHTLLMGHFDYCLMLRSLHEITDTLGGKERFFEKVKHVLNHIKKGGKLIIADPQYIDEVNNHPLEHNDVVSLVRKFQEETTGHSHLPEDYVTYTELEERMSLLGFKLLKRDVLPNKNATEYAAKNGLKLDYDPYLFYVDTFEKV